MEDRLSMNAKSIEKIVKDKMCASCGICVGVCSKEAISLEKSNWAGSFFPKVNKEKCVECGLCVKVCPGKTGVDEALNVDFQEVILQQTEAKTVLSGMINDVSMLAKSTSGGIISELIRTLLEERLFDFAFVVDTYNYENLIETKRYNYGDAINSGGSRYIQVSHSGAVRYILKHRNEKIILVGTGCAIRGLDSVIHQCHLRRENYLLIGLFCDKTMTYHVWDYFSRQASVQKNPEIKELYFRTKAVSGWPGDVRLVCGENKIDLPKTKRAEVKDFFCAERCLFCLDKLNAYADISVGDNYTGKNDSIKGSSSIIIRTEFGEKVFSCIRDRCSLFESAMDEIVVSQEVKKRKENKDFAQFRWGNKRLMMRKPKLYVKYLYKRFKILIGDIGHSNQWILKIFIVLEQKLKQG